MNAPGWDDPYECLGIRPGASLSEIRRAYRRAAQKHHPDRNPLDPHAHDKFIRIQKAYKSLLETPYQEPPSSEPSHPSSAPSSVHSRPDLQDTALNLEVELPLDQVGQAQERIVSAKVAYPCPQCQGQGALNCPGCYGSGQRMATRKWRIIIPAHTPEGTGLVGRGLGHRSGRFARPGDIIVRVRWSGSGVWRWEEGRLVARIPLSARLRKKGGVYPLRMPDGRWVWWTIPPNTSVGQGFGWKSLFWYGMISDAWIVVEKGWCVFSFNGRRPPQSD